METKDIIIIILAIIIILYNWNNITKLYKRINKNINPIKHKEIQSDISLITKEQDVIQKHIQSDISENIRNKKLRQLLIYILENGKKIRPIIIISTYKHLNKTEQVPEYIINTALCIEYIHSASLVIDDIMDNDEERRGKPSAHIKYDLNMAQLAAIILCTLAMQNLFKSLDQLTKAHSNINKDIYVILGNLISQLTKELCIGQYLDITIPKNINELGDNIKDSIKFGKLETTIEELIHKKTSTLFEFCFIIPWVYSNYDKSEGELLTGINKMKNIARHFGLIFQITDDFEDVEQDSQRDGKNSVMNYVISKGYYDAYKDYHKLVKKFNKLIEDENIMTPEINQIVDYLSKKVDVYYSHC